MQKSVNKFVDVFFVRADGDVLSFRAHFVDRVDHLFNKLARRSWSVQQAANLNRAS